MLRKRTFETVIGRTWVLYTARVVERASEVREKRIDRAAREMARRGTRQ